jgi:hypothetical protein
LKLPRSISHALTSKIPFYVRVFSEKELCGLSPNFHIRVSVSNLYISRIGPHIFLRMRSSLVRMTEYCMKKKRKIPPPKKIFFSPCSRIGRPIMGIYKSFTDTWKLGLRLRNSFSGNICLEFSVLVLCSVQGKRFQIIITKP